MNAHPLSTSRSELRIEDGLTRLSVWMPLTEMEHVRGEDRKLTSLFRINGQPPVSERCTIADVDFVCEATFLVPEPRDIETRLPERVLPNHIHLLRAGSQQRAFTADAPRQSIDRIEAVPWAAILSFGVALLVAAWFGLRTYRRRVRQPNGP